MLGFSKNEEGALVMEELSELASGNAGELPVLANCTGLPLFSPSGMDSQGWGYWGKDAASSCSPSSPSPWMEDFSCFAWEHPLSSGSCGAPGPALEAQAAPG